MKNKWFAPLLTKIEPCISLLPYFICQKHIYMPSPEMWKFLISTQLNKKCETWSWFPSPFSTPVTLSFVVRPFWEFAKFTACYAVVVYHSAYNGTANKKKHSDSTNKTWVGWVLTWVFSIDDSWPKCWTISLNQQLCKDIVWGNTAKNDIFKMMKICINQTIFWSTLLFCVIKAALICAAMLFSCTPHFNTSCSCFTAIWPIL